MEKERPSVHSASEYQSGNVKSFGDIYDIPTKNISLYAGVEDGKFKVDSLQNFNPQTTIYPVRNVKKGLKKIHGIDIGTYHDLPFENMQNFDRILMKMPQNDSFITTRLTLKHPESNPQLYKQFQEHGQHILNNVENLSNQEKRAIKRLVSGKPLKNGSFSMQPLMLTQLLRSVTSTERGNFTELDPSKILPYLQRGYTEKKIFICRLRRK